MCLTKHTRVNQTLIINKCDNDFQFFRPKQANRLTDYGTPASISRHVEIHATVVIFGDSLRQTNMKNVANFAY